MNFINTTTVTRNLIQAGVDKTRLSVTDLLIRGMLSGSILGFGSTLAFTATVQSGLPILGAAIFPACFVIVILMGLELVTGSFAVLPLSFLDKKIGFFTMAKNIGIVFLANLLGGLLYALLFWASLTSFGHDSGGALAEFIVKSAEAKTIGYVPYGAAGWATAFIKGVLCNWMVTTGVVLGMSSTSSTGKIAAAWLPVFLFFGQGFEHAVVNMFLIPAGMLLGGDIDMVDWWWLNQLPVTLGNLAGGIFFTAMALYFSFGKKEQAGDSVVIAPSNENTKHEAVA